MTLSLGQTLDSAGCITRLRDLIGQEPGELEKRIGYHAGRLANGYWIALLKSSLQPADFVHAGYTHFSGGRIGAPDLQKRPFIDAKRPPVQDQLAQRLGAGGVASMQQKTVGHIPLTGLDRMAKVLPAIPHSSDMDKDANQPVQYPVGSGIMQLILTVKKPFLIAAEVDRAGKVTGVNGFTSQIAPSVRYEERVKLRQYLEAA